MIHNVNDAALRRDVLSQLLLVNSLINADMERGLGPTGLTAARAQVLWELGAAPGMSQRALAERLGVTPRNVTTLIDALERTGFVERQAHPADRRTTKLALTAKGQAAYAQFQQGMGAFASALFADFSAERLQALSRTLADIAAKLEELD